MPGANPWLPFGLLVVTMAGCFEPRYPVGIPCSEAQTCPPGQTCDVDGVCRLTPLPAPDAGAPPLPDAGGPDAGRCVRDEQCPDGMSCNLEGACVAPACDDDVHNGTETDVDCGGGCSPCPLGKACEVAADCLQGACVERVCAEPPPGCESCDANAACVEPGGAQPCQCSAGYRGDGFTCADIDECLEQSHSCSANATCANSPGAFACTCNSGFYGDGTSCARPTSCASLMTLDPSAPNGLHVIDPDGNGPAASLTVFCDMTSDGGGWTLIGDYVSNAELFDFDPSQHQLQNSSGGAAVLEPPLLDGTRTGHIAYDSISFSTVRLQCRSNAAQEWFSAQTELVSDWRPGDRGVYGSDHWVVVGDGNHGRSNHFICGYAVNTTGIYAGVAICSGPGVGGSFRNHVVSLSFNHNAGSYTGGLSIGCNGTGLNNGKDASWQARAWLR